MWMLAGAGAGAHSNLLIPKKRMKNHTLDDGRYLWDEEGIYRLHNQHFAAVC